MSEHELDQLAVALLGTREWELYQRGYFSPSTSRDDLQLLLEECKRRELWGAFSHRIKQRCDPGDQAPYFTEVLLLPTRDLCEAAVRTLEANQVEAKR